MSLEPLAELSDIATRLGRDLTDAETRRVPGLLADASALVRSRSVTGQEFTRRTSTVRRRIVQGHVVLPQRPVNAVTAVTHPITAEPVSRYRWNGLNIVYVFLWNPYTDFEMPWRPGFDVVDITNDHGYDEIPDDVVGVVANVVVRALGIKPADASLTGESIEGYSYSRDASIGVWSLTADEKAVLRPYSAGAKARTVRMV